MSDRKSYFGAGTHRQSLGQIISDASADIQRLIEGTEGSIAGGEIDGPAEASHPRSHESAMQSDAF